MQKYSRSWPDSPFLHPCIRQGALAKGPLLGLHRGKRNRAALTSARDFIPPPLMGEEKSLEAELHVSLSFLSIQKGKCAEEPIFHWHMGLQGETCHSPSQITAAIRGFRAVFFPEKSPFPLFFSAQL